MRCPPGSRWGRHGLKPRSRRRSPSAGNRPGWGESARGFWAFQLPRSSTPPPVKDSRWPRSPIDRFILSRLESEGLHPAPPADKRTLLRRATLDLVGIPASLEELDAFETDDSAHAFERVVDRLLASPRYGERWGRHWLDAVRYADSNGMDDNLTYSDAWRYRDYVIKAFNSDKSFDRFLEEQIAGDLIAEAEPSAGTSGSSRRGSWRSGRRCWPRMIPSSSRWTSSTSNSTRRAASSSA